MIIIIRIIIIIIKTTTLICYARLTQCSKPVKNRKRPVF